MLLLYYEDNKMLSKVEQLKRICHNCSQQCDLWLTCEDKVSHNVKQG
jgi:hypothetical protein